MENKIEINYLEIDEKQEYYKIIKEVLTECFKEEKIDDTPLSISITLTNLEQIQKINNEHRNIDKPTDVLSFPMFEKEELDKMINEPNWEYNDILGDMIISIEQVEIQAKDYGHSFKRELSYMVVHSFYHLMGYDHIKEEDKNEMRPKEEYVLNELGITRE